MKTWKGLNNGKPSIGFRTSIPLQYFVCIRCNSLFFGHICSSLMLQSSGWFNHSSLLSLWPWIIPYLLFYFCYHLFLLENFVQNHFDHTDFAFMLRPFDLVLSWIQSFGNNYSPPTLSSVGIWFIYILLFIIALIPLQVWRRVFTLVFFGEEVWEKLLLIE